MRPEGFFASSPSEQGIILKEATTFSVSGGKQAGKSKQMPADPFARLYGQYGLVTPPYRLERLAELREANSVHSACISQKAADIAGLGWDFVAEDGIEKPDTKQRDAIKDFIKGCNPDYTFQEILVASQDDYESLGWFVAEVIRDLKGRPKYIHHMPGHTVRAHRDGVRFAQYREGHLRWFKRLGAEGTFDLKTGEPKEDTHPAEDQAGEVLVVRRLASRSSYYGVPDWVSAIGAIIGSLVQRDFNINFFKGNTIPDVLLVISGADVSKDARTTLQNFFNVEAKGEHHKLCMLPIPAAAAAAGVKAELHRLTPDLKDAHFRLYKQDNAIEICVAHRVPPYRIGWPIMGSMGGATAKEMLETYKDSVVEPGQEILEHRFNQQLFPLLFAEDGKEVNMHWRWKLHDLDLTDKVAEMQNATTGFEKGILLRNEARGRIGEEPVDEEKYRQAMEAGEIGGQFVQADNVNAVAPEGETEGDEFGGGSSSTIVPGAPGDGEPGASIGATPTDVSAGQNIPAQGAPMRGVRQKRISKQDPVLSSEVVQALELVRDILKAATPPDDTVTPAEQAYVDDYHRIHAGAEKEIQGVVVDFFVGKRKG